MDEEKPEPLWREVVGDTEPWRRGRLFLIGLAFWSLLTQTWLVGTAFLAGAIELTLALSLGASVFWLTYYFIWIGVHWVRWLSAGLSGLLGFAKLIWGIRDGNAIFLIDGTISFVLAAYLGLAPSVYFFALRQKELVRWKEAAAVAAVFLVLLASLAVTIVGLGAYKLQIDGRGRDFAARAFRRIYVEGDTEFLRAHATERLLRESGWGQLSGFMADRYMRIGVARELTPPQGRLQFAYRFPVSLAVLGRMSCQAIGNEGNVRLHFMLVQTDGEWQIDALWWRYAYGD